MLSKKNINLAINYLKENKVIILPTDTIYGLSAKYSLENEVKINNLKKSKNNKKLIVLFSKIRQIKHLIKVNKKFKKNLKSKNPITQIVESFGTSIALRIVKRKDLKKIINKVGLIFSTSVNYSGQNYIETLDELKNFNQQVKGIFWDGFLYNKPSKIINLISNKIIRE